MSIIKFQIILITGLFLALTNIGLNAQEKPIDRKVELTFDYDHISLGAVVKGETRDTLFSYTNTGNEDILIEGVSACECTTIDYPREPIKPGEKGKIQITFDSGEKDEAETINIDVMLKNTDPKTGWPMNLSLSYDFDIIKE